MFSMRINTQTTCAMSHSVFREPLSGAVTARGVGDLICQGDSCLVKHVRLKSHQNDAFGFSGVSSL